VFGALLVAMDRGAPDLYADAAAQWLATHLLDRQGTGLQISTDRRLPGVLTDRRLAKVVEYMSANFADSLTIEQLAAEAAISKFHFVRLFCERVGEPPHAFLVRLRMDNARRLLTTTDLSIGDVAIECGYRTAAAFVAAFVKHSGKTPTKFRRQTPWRWPALP
jgi:AraC family transcriptional regulator